MARMARGATIAHTTEVPGDMACMAVYMEDGVLGVGFRSAVSRVHTSMMKPCESSRERRSGIPMHSARRAVSDPTNQGHRPSPCDEQVIDKWTSFMAEEGCEEKGDGEEPSAGRLTDVMTLS